jgi:hypothetical protein
LLVSDPSLQGGIRKLMEQAREAGPFSVKGKQQRTKDKVMPIANNEIQIIFDLRTRNISHSIGWELRLQFRYFIVTVYFLSLCESDIASNATLVQASDVARTILPGLSSWIQSLICGYLCRTRPGRTSHSLPNDLTGSLKCDQRKILMISHFSVLSNFPDSHCHEFLAPILQCIGMSRDGMRIWNQRLLHENESNCVWEKYFPKTSTSDQDRSEKDGKCDSRIFKKPRKVSWVESGIANHICSCSNVDLKLFSNWWW